MIRIKRYLRKTTKHTRNHLTYRDKARTASGKHHSIQLLWTNARIAQRALYRLAHTLKQWFKYRLEALLRPVHGERFTLDLNAHHHHILCGQTALYGLSRMQQPSIHPGLARLFFTYAYMLHKASHDQLIHIFATQTVVTCSGPHFHHTIE